MKKTIRIPKGMTRPVVRSVVKELFIAALPRLITTFLGIVMVIVLIVWVVTK